MLPRQSISRRGLIAGSAVAAFAVPRVVRAAFNPYLNQHALYLNDGTLFTDGASHPASGLYANIGALRTVYPFATALTNELNWLIVQDAIYQAGAVGAKIYVGYALSGIRMTNANSALDGSGPLRFGDYGDTFNPGASANLIFAGEGLGTIFYWPDDLGRPAATGNFTATISAPGVMTVTVAGANPIIPGMLVNGTGIAVWATSGPDAGASKQRVICQLTGTPGSAGTYQLSNAQTAVTSPSTFSATFATNANPWGRRTAIECGVQNDQFSGWYGQLRDFTMYGPGVGSTLGASSSEMIGLCTTDRVDLKNIQIGYTLGAGTSVGFWAGISLTGGQTKWENVRSNNNYIGVDMPTQTQEFGNIVFDHCDFASNNRGGFSISPTASLQSCKFIGGNMDTQPYSIWCEPWSSALIAALGYGPDTFDPQLLTLACDFDTAQFENIGNAIVGDGLAPVTLTGSISGTTLTVTVGTPQVGHLLQQISGGPAIAANTYVIAGSGSTWTVSVSQTVAPGQITATKARYMHRTRLYPAEALWGGTGFKIAAEQRTAMFDIASMSGVIRPMTNFAWSPGTDSIFGFTHLSAAIGAVNPQPGLVIEGDLSSLINNCLSGSTFGGHGFFGSSAFITPGYVELREPGFWKGTVAPTFDSGYPGTPICGLGQVVLRHIAAAGTPVLCTGAVATDDVMGIVILVNTWPLIVTSGEVPVASGANTIFAGNLVQTASGGAISAVSGTPTGTVIGRATANSGGGFTTVRLQGLE